MIHLAAEAVSAKQRAFRHDVIISLVILVIALIWRISAVVLGPVLRFYGDMVNYNHIAEAITQQGVYSYWGVTPDAQITPGYPLFLSLCYALANVFYPHQHDYQLFFSMIGQAVLSAVSVFLVYKISRFVMRIRYAVIITILWAFYPPAIWSATLLLTETLYTCLLLLTLYTFFVAYLNRTRPLWVLCGLIFGLCSLVRPTPLPFIGIPILIWLIPNTRRSRRPYAPGMMYILGFILPLVPWWIRNWLSLHHIILTDTDAGNPLLYGSDPNFRTDTWLGQGLDPTEQTHLAIQRIFFGFTHEFWTYLWWYTFGKLTLLFATPWYPNVPMSAKSFWDLLLLMSLHLHIIWVVLGTVGMLLGFSHSFMRYISFFVALLVLLQLPFIPVNRYAYPLMPLFFVGVGYLAEWVHGKWKVPQGRKTCYSGMR